jgi:hypothetical protein
MPTINSTFTHFPSTPFGIHEHLMTLRQERLSSEMYNKINDLYYNQPGLATEVADIFNTPLAQINMIDDFAAEFDSLALKICVALTTFMEFFLSLPLFYSLILYDRYGGDSMKRSLSNYLTSQFAYPVIILIIFNRPTIVWRVFMGPLNSTVADFSIFIQNSTGAWVILCQTEGILTQALFVTNYKYVCGINDKLLSTFLFLVNVGFSFGSHFYLFFFGCLGSDELLVGVENTKRMPSSIFYDITIGATSLIFGGSLVIIAANKFISFRKDKNLVKNINITLNNEEEGQAKRKLNTSKHNKPIISTILAVGTTFLFSGIMIYYFTFFHNEVSHSEYIQRFWFLLSAKLLLITTIPILLFVFFLKDFRNFILNELKQNLFVLSFLTAADL